MKKLSASNLGSTSTISGNTLAELNELVLDWMASLGKNYQKDLSLGKAA